MMGTGIMLDKDADEFFLSKAETWEERISATSQITSMTIFNMRLLPPYLFPV